MPRLCTICSHEARTAIKDALQSGTSLRTIAGCWSVSKTSLLRHRDAHLSTVPGIPPPTAAEHQELLATMRQYCQLTARITALQAVPGHDWPQRFTRPREEVLANLRSQQRILADQLRTKGVIRAPCPPRKLRLRKPTHSPESHYEHSPAHAPHRHRYLPRPSAATEACTASRGWYPGRSPTCPSPGAGWPMEV